MLISVSHVTKIYRLGNVEVKAVDDVSFVIDKGEYVAVMGPSGSGKSSLMNILGCLDTPSSGEYYLDGVAVAHMSDDDLAIVRNRRIGFVFQTFNLLSMDTAINNVELPLLYAGVKAGERRMVAEAALGEVGLSGRKNHRPSEMSGGERQRVAIARALVNNPPILLADEPTGNLDSHTGAEILRIFDTFALRGKIIILVTHDEQVARHARRLLHIKDGKIISDEKF